MPGVEGKYAHVLRSIEDENQLSNSDVAHLAIFVDTLFRRTEASIEFWQGEFDKIEKIFRSVDYANNHNEEYSDTYWNGSHEIGKSMVLDHAGVMAEILINVGVSIVVNDSGLPFFTSDNPVTHRISHLDELHSVGVPKSWTHDHIGTNEEYVFCFCPLSPKYAFISSKFLKPTDGKIYRNTHDKNFVIGMNSMTQSHAKSLIVSSSDRPYGIYQEHVVKATEYAKSEYVNNQKGDKLKIYTNRQRFEISITDFEHNVFTNGHITEVHFRTEDIDVLKIISSHEKIERILHFVDGKEMAGSRGLKFHYVSVEKKEASILVDD